MCGCLMVVAPSPAPSHQVPGPGEQAASPHNADTGDNVETMSDPVQSQQGRRGPEVRSLSSVIIAEVKYGEGLPHAQAQAGQGAMDLKKRPEPGDQAEAGKLTQVNIPCPTIPCIVENVNLFWSWLANKYLLEEEIIVTSVLCLVWVPFVLKARVRRAKKRRNKRKCQWLEQENGSSETGRQTFVLFSDFQHSIRFDI